MNALFLSTVILIGPSISGNFELWIASKAEDQRLYNNVYKWNNGRTKRCHSYKWGYNGRSIVDWAPTFPNR